MEKLRVRRDWRAFSRAQKRAYIESVLCLTHLPSSTPAKDARGAKNRYDDFVAVHIVKSDFVHRTVRVLTRIFFKALMIGIGCVLVLAPLLCSWI